MKTFLLIAVLLLVSACGKEGETVGFWTREDFDRTVTTCTQNAERYYGAPRAKEMCTCIYVAASSEVAFEQYSSDSSLASKYSKGCY